LKVGFLEAAEYELQCAMDYYKQQKQGLGHEFLAEIKAAVARITDFPEAWQPLRNADEFDSPLPSPLQQERVLVAEVILCAFLRNMHKLI